ncbi:MAG: peptidylprolyl isomerase [Syntrophothermus sp.]
MRVRILSVLSALMMFILSSCTPEHSKIVVAEYGGEKISLGELENVYAKNAGGIDAAKKDSLSKIKNFLDLYVNFKMKLKDAQLRGFDKNQALQSELNDYKEKVGSTYLVEKEMVNPGIRDLYEKRKTELRAAHIMLRPDTMSDAQARAFAQSLLERIKKGESFEELAKQYSADQYSKNSGGDVYYLTAGAVVPEFEDAAYKTPVGQVYPEVVKTRFGYHIIKVTEKHDRVPAVKAAHIMIDMRQDSGKVDTVKALAKIKDIQTQLRNGADFAELARKYSEDPGTKESGGDLGFFERKMIVKEFDEAAFNLLPGMISDIIKTRYGYHILKVYERKPMPSFEESKEELKQLYKKTRYDYDYPEFVEKLKKSYDFQVNNNTVDMIDKNADTTKVGQMYLDSKLRSTVKDQVLYTWNGGKCIVDSFFTKIAAMPEFSEKKISGQLVIDALKKVSETQVLDLEVKSLDQKDPQFAALMDDYRNGIYIFKLQEDEIWGKIKLDSVKLAEFWEGNKAKYTWPDRVEFSEIFANEDSSIQKYFKMLKAGENFDSLAAKYTERPGFKEKAGKYGLVDIKSGQLAEEANKLTKPGEYSAPFPNANGYSIVRLISKDGARQKTFEEARAEVSGQFQEEESKRLEKEYIDSLKGTYKPVSHYEELEKAYKLN